MFEGMVDRAFSRTSADKSRDYPETQSALVPPRTAAPRASLHHAPTKP